MVWLPELQDCFVASQCLLWLWNFHFVHSWSPNRVKVVLSRTLNVLSLSFDENTSPLDGLLEGTISSSSPPPPSSSSNLSSNTYSVSRVVSRIHGQQIMDGTLMPSKEYGDRIGLGGEAHGISGRILSSNDPELTMTYGEFPLSSLDELVDVGLKHLPENNYDKNTGAVRYDITKRRTSFVDIGSGCGRLAIYSALTRGFQQVDCKTNHQNEGITWTVHGIEIANLLHDQAVQIASTTGMQSGWFAHELIHDSVGSEGNSPGNHFDGNTLSLHVGPAEQYRDILGTADIIFSYCTTFPASFSPNLGAMVLSPEWSQLLSESCQAGCVAITTDRALDPQYGWNLVERRDVENPEVFGSTGYIHVLSSK